MTNKRTTLTFWDSLNIKVKVGKLQFDFLLNDNFFPSVCSYSQEKHNHLAYEIQLIISGRGKLILGEEEYPLEGGSVHIIGPTKFHAVQLDATDPINRITLRFTFHETNDAEPIMLHTESDLFRKVLSSISYCKLSDAPFFAKISNLLEDIRHELEAPTFGSHTCVNNLFSQVVALIAREIQSDYSKTTGYSFPSKVKDGMRSSIIDLFFTDYQQPLTLDMLAARLGLGSKQTNRLLKQYFHSTFKQKLLETRVEVAKDLLRTRSYSIERIALEVGYGSAHYFNRMFQRIVGMSPVQYRRLHSDNN